ncbi:MAG: C69 family dipeptidase [Planctomycetaceae bacterium]|nr:C69 family dipeptidase [Planctomycetaceae bacterium]
MKRQITIVLAILICGIIGGVAAACTNVLVTKGASADGSVLITYTADSAGFYATLELYPAADHAPGTMILVPGKDGIPQVPHTYQVLGSSGQGIMNEFQLAMAETTFGGRDELQNEEGTLMYPLLMTLGLQRAKTAREAIVVMTQLVEQHGYGDVGESISIADKDEAWVLEIIGMGKGRKGAVWVALRVPDGEISCHANQARIGTFPLDDPDNCLYSDNVIAFAVEMGYYDSLSGKPFHFADAYAPADVKSKRVCEARVWSVYRRAAPSLNLSADYHRGVAGAESYPWSIKPDSKLSTADVMALMRDHYDGTEFDMTQGIDAGDYGMPRRWRPLYWKLDETDEQEYSWERPISTQQTGFSFVTQSRNALPDPVGGVVWYGVDDSYLTCYFPLYCTIDKLPQSYVVGSIERFSPDSAWWMFNLVSNYANLKYSHMMPEIRAVQQELESTFFTLQPAIERAAADLYAVNPQAMQTYLTDYSVMQAEKVTQRWQELFVHLVTKYNDGYVRDENGKYPNVGYPREWLQRVVQERPTQFLLPNDDATATKTPPLLPQSPPQMQMPATISTVPEPVPPQPATGIPLTRATGTQPQQISELPPMGTIVPHVVIQEDYIPEVVIQEEPNDDLPAFVLADNQYLVDIRSGNIALYFQNTELNVWRNQVNAAMQRFQLAQKRLPDSEAEFVEKIIAANGIILPELCDGCVYVYLPEVRQMMILVTKEKP